MFSGWTQAEALAFGVVFLCVCLCVCVCVMCAFCRTFFSPLQTHPPRLLETAGLSGLRPRLDHFECMTFSLPSIVAVAPQHVPANQANQANVKETARAFCGGRRTEAALCTAISRVWCLWRSRRVKRTRVGGVCGARSRRSTTRLNAAVRPNVKRGRLV